MRGDSGADTDTVAPLESREVGAQGIPPSGNCIPTASLLTASSSSSSVASGSHLPSGTRAEFCSLYALLTPNPALCSVTFPGSGDPHRLGLSTQVTKYRTVRLKRREKALTHFIFFLEKVSLPSGPPPLFGGFAWRTLKDLVCSTTYIKTPPSEGTYKGEMRWHVWSAWHQHELCSVH